MSRVVIHNYAPRRTRDADAPSEAQVRQIVKARNPGWSAEQVEAEVRRAMAAAEGSGSKTGRALQSKALRLR